MDEPAARSKRQPRKATPVKAAAEPVEARATISLPGLPAGTTATVHPDDPYIAALIRRGYLAVG